MGKTTHSLIRRNTMPYSKDPLSYDEDERRLMLAALGEDITIRCKDARQAFALRGRLYGLRKAVTYAYDMLQDLEKKGKDTRGYDSELIRAAPAIRSLGLRFADARKVTLIIGRGAAIAPETKSAIQQALAGIGKETAEEEHKQGITAMMERLAATAPDTTETSFAEIGYAPRPNIAENGTGAASANTATPLLELLTYDRVYAMAATGKKLTTRERGVLEAGPKRENE